MSKYLLVIDEPNNCADCPCFYDYLCCQAKSGIRVLDEERPKDCPLKPIPEKNKYNVEKYATVDFENNITLGDYLNIGWNACIDEILMRGN